MRRSVGRTSQPIRSSGERMTDADAPLHTRQDGAVLRITFNRPERRNALTDAMIMTLLDAIETAENTDSVRVISIDSANDNFCSGFDLSQRGKPDTPPRFGATQRRLRVDINRFITTMFECQTPIVAAVCGHAQGLGLAIALAADVAIVADDAVLRAPFTAIGMTPDSGLAWLLPRLVGIARAKQMVLLAEPVSGVQAADWGLVMRSVRSADVAATANEIVDQFAASATVAVGLAKNLMYRGLTTEMAAHLHNEAIGLEMSSRTEDFKEPRRAKRDNHPINFQGR